MNSWNLQTKVIFSYLYKQIVVIKVNMSTRGQLKTQDKVEHLLGAILLMGGAYKLTKYAFGYCRYLYNYHNYMKIDYKKKHKISQLVANPSSKEVTFLQVTFKASRQTFRNHFSKLSEVKNKETSAVYIYNQQCDTFEATTVENDKKYRLICKPRFLNMYMTSTLLENMKSLEKSTQKKPFTALAYGQIQYSPKNKNLSFLVSSLTMSKLETDEIWLLTLGRKSYIKFLLYGVVVGIGFAIVKNNLQHYREYYQQVRQMLNKYYEQKPFQ